MAHWHSQFSSPEQRRYAAECRRLAAAARRPKAAAPRNAAKPHSEGAHWLSQLFAPRKIVGAHR